MGLMLRVVFFGLLLFFLFYLYRKLMGFLRLSSSSSSSPPPITGQVHKDPQCGIYVAEELALKAPARGQQYYFCSAECRDRFRAEG